MKKNLDEFVQNVEDSTNEILEDTLLDEEAPFENTRNITYDDIVKISTKDKMSKLPWLVSIILIFIIALIIGYSFFQNNPQTIFISSIDNFFKSINDSIGENSYDVSRGNIKFSFNINSNDEKELFNQLSKVKYNINYSIDRVNDLSLYKVHSKYDDDKLLDFNIYRDKDSIYLYSKELYDSYIKLDEKVKRIKIKDFKVLLNGINQALDKVSSTEKITGSKISYDLGNKSIKAYEAKLVINKDNYGRLSDLFINTLKSNGEFLSVYSKITDLPLDSYFIKNIVNDKSEIKVYSNRKTNEFLKIDLNTKKGNITISRQDDGYNITLKENSKNINLDLNIKNKSNIILEFKYSDNNVSGDGNIVISNNESKNFGKVNLNKVIKEEDISDFEKEEIIKKIESNPNLNKIYNLIK